MDIKIIGSLDGSAYYSANQIISLLNESESELNYGSEFMGRPGTKIYSGETDVLKLRSELELGYTQLQSWAQHTLKQEQQFKVHHPKKTWFLVERNKGNTQVGSICPRLTPLHVLCADNENWSAEKKLLFIHKIYQYYFNIATTFNKRLDEGLSNFGVDEQNTLYYLDDDIYTWDNFVSFSHVLGVLIRNNTWLDETVATTFAQYLQQLISQLFPESNTCINVAGKLRDIFMPAEKNQRVLDVIIKQLHNNKIISKKLKFNPRYWAIFADVHANLPALEAVLDYLSQEKIDQGIVIGDIVGYGPHPENCIERLQSAGFEVLKGNHDHAASSNETKGMSSSAKWCIEWSRPRLSKQHKSWLEQLPMEFYGETDLQYPWLAVHGSPVDPSYCYGYVYEMTYANNLSALEKRGINLCFHGHSHIQGIYARKNLPVSDAFYSQEQQSLHAYKHSLICPGSVGQPRNGFVGAQFAIYDQKNHSIRFVNINYTSEKTIQDMTENHFPESLATRLKTGY